MNRIVYSFDNLNNTNPEDHANRLRRGLKRLPEMVATICDLCEGRGEREQRYTIGCGFGLCHAIGVCDYCNGSGLLQGNEPAPDSVLNQVLVAGEKETPVG